MTPEQRSRLLERAGWSWSDPTYWGQPEGFWGHPLLPEERIKKSDLLSTFSQIVAEQVADAVTGREWNWNMKRYAAADSPKRFAAWIEGTNVMGRSPTRAQAIENMLARWLEEQDG